MKASTNFLWVLHAHADASGRVTREPSIMSILWSDCAGFAPFAHIAILCTALALAPLMWCVYSFFAEIELNLMLYVRHDFCGDDSQRAP